MVEEYLQQHTPMVNLEQMEDKLQKTLDTAAETIINLVEEGEKRLRREKAEGSEKYSQVLHAACQKAQAELLGLATGIPKHVD